jgi:hypothetical protein
MISFCRLLLVLGAIVSLALLAPACGPLPSVTEGIVEPTGAEQTGTGPLLASPPAAPTSVPAGSGEPAASGREIRLTPVQPVSPEPVPTVAVGPVTGEVPGRLLDTILADAAARSTLEPGAFTVVRAEAVTWSDGSLGCPQPGMMYTQTPVDGYWVVLQQGDQTFDYRARESGFFFLCEGQQLPGSVLPGPEVSGTPQQ